MIQTGNKKKEMSTGRIFAFYKTLSSFVINQIQLIK